MLSQRSRTRPRARRGAIHAVELLLLLPIVLTLILGMVEYSMILTIDQQLAVASRQAARVAAQGGSAAEVEAAARLTLGTGSVGQHADISAQLGVASGDAVAVRVAVADAATVVPNMLRYVGFSIKDKPLAGLTVMRKE